MYEDGFTNILSTDISEVCIERQKSAFPHLEWQVADLRNMDCFQNESFDVVIEKATLDALLVKEKSPWHPSEEAKIAIGNPKLFSFSKYYTYQYLFVSDECLCEISRVLKSKDAKFLSLTFAQPHFRTPFYSKTRYLYSNIS